MGPTTQGDLFEARVMEAAVCRGLRCDVAYRNLAYDLLIAGKRVQCKSKTLQKGGIALHATRRLLRSEFDVLAITYRVTTNDPFGLVYLIPACCLPGDDDQLNRQLQQRWLAQRPEYIENWSAFDEQV